MKILATQRRDKIIDLLREDGSAKVAKLAQVFKVSEVTIRQDLEHLEQEGKLVREHGGAYLEQVEHFAKNLALFNQENLDKKSAIAEKAIEYIHDGEIIILDSGSTTTEIAKRLKKYHNLTVITNSLNIGLEIGGSPGIELMVTGGDFKPPTLSLTGQKAADFFSNIHVDKLFLATAGISLKSGLTYPSISDIVVKKAMIDAADEVYLVADSTKIGKSSLASLGALSLIDYIITDSGIDDEHKKLFKDHQIEFILA